MRRTLLSWPVKAIVLVVPVICGSGAAYAQSPSLEYQQAVHLATLEWDWIPAGSLPIPQKPKATAWTDDLTALPAGGLIVPPKPKARDDGEAGGDEYPSGAPIIPPKPKLTSNIQY